jgi:hypothetical protein
MRVDEVAIGDTRDIQTRLIVWRCAVRSQTDKRYLARHLVRQPFSAERGIGSSGESSSATCEEWGRLTLPHTSRPRRR